MADDHAIAASVARAAGELLVELRGRLLAAGTSGRELGQEGDRRAHALIVERLTAAAPAGDVILSEEALADPARLGAERVWIVDPLDGTREYSEPGRGDWAVHVALVRSERPEAGAVALPAEGVVLSTGSPPVVPPRAGGAPARVVVSRSRPPAVAAQVAAALGGELVPLGSAGAKAMAVVRGEADVYVHDGGQYEWDSCAPAAVAVAAGLHVSRIDGRPLRYNQPDPYLPDLLICRPALAATVLAVTAPVA